VSGGGSVTLTGALTYTGDTNVTASTLDVGDLTYSANVTVSGGATLEASSVVTGTLTIGDDPTLAITGGPEASGELTAVPEPSTFVLLSIAALGLIGAAWRRRNR
ncbi:MAG: PEP-CTERM sorting domain-containing protein, partial [Thermoguttaceae bacterium]